MISRRHMLLGLAGLPLAVREAAARDFWGELLPDQPSDFLFGYGTLINEPSRTRTSGRSVTAVPARIAARFGYERAFNARSRSGFTALGLRRAGANGASMSINGVVFPVMGDEMAKFDARESGYARMAVPPDMIEAVGWLPLPRDARVWIYIPPGTTGTLGEGLKPPAADYPIVQSYVDVVLEGALDVGPAFARELVATTAEWSRYWLNDRETARRPWVATPKAGAIDRILSDVEPAAARFADRLYGEAYAARYLLQERAAPAESR